MFSKRPCPTCKSHEAHIASLQSEIESLRKLVHVPNTALRIPELQLEADMVLNGAGDAIQVTSEETAEALRANLEASQILSGSY